jgi:hypothetical protein
MEPRRNPPEYFLEIFADSNSVKDVLKGETMTCPILHATCFFLFSPHGFDDCPQN